MKKIIIIILMMILVAPTHVFAETTIGTKAGSPVGTVITFTGDALPDGYLLANGASLSRTEYAALYNVIGTTYGSADSTHFNLPNLNGRVVVGLSSSDTEFNSLGKTGGAKTVALTSSQLPAHTHTYSGTTTSTGSTHTHTFTNGGSALVTGASSSHSGMPYANGFTYASGSGWFTNVNKNTSSIQSSGAHTHTYNGTTDPSGASTVTAHNNLQPYITLKYIIKVK